MSERENDLNKDRRKPEKRRGVGEKNRVTRTLMGLILRKCLPTTEKKEFFDRIDSLVIYIFFYLLCANF